MKTKNIILSIVITASLLVPISCKDYLEMPKQGSFNKDAVFANIRNTEIYLYSLYQYVPKILYGWSNPAGLNGPSRVTISDEGICGLYFYRSNDVYVGAVNSSWFTTANGEDIFSWHWTTIKRCIVMLQNIDNVPDATPEIKGRYKGECNAIMALEYLEMFKRYGGLPIVKDLINFTENPKIPRESIDATYKYIISLCDAVIANPDIPAIITNQIEFGRATKAWAYGIKARAALYAASPLFNSATPYLDFGENNKLICYTNYDVNRWKTARDYALDAIQFCESNGYAMVTSFGINRNYTVACEKYPNNGNTELIIATLKNPGLEENVAGSALVYTAWKAKGLAAAGGRNMVNHNAVEFYQNTDGSRVNWEQKITTAPNDPTAPYKNLEPRFQQSIGYNGALWQTAPLLKLEFYDPGETGVISGINGMIKTTNTSNYGFHKYYHDFEASTAGYMPLNPIMRLAEMYTIAAEASNEFQGPNAKAFDLIDVIRTRSGMPKLDRTMSQTSLREAIRNECAVEFFAEDHRYFDLKRWKTPDPFKKIYNLKILKYMNNTYTYEKYLSQTRVWNDFWYLHPFPLAEVLKNYGLIQNPGW
jgi:hypothetical protein